MGEPRHIARGMVDFVAGFAGSDTFPLSEAGWLDEILEGLAVEGDHWLLRQLSRPFPHLEKRRIFLLDQESTECYLTEDGKFLVHDSNGWGQISSREAADKFGAIPIAEALSARIMEKLADYQKFTQIWHETDQKVREAIRND